MGGIILVAIGGFILIEGLMWAMAPTAMRRAYDEMMRQVTDRDLHRVVAVLGLAGRHRLLLCSHDIASFRRSFSYLRCDGCCRDTASL